MKINLTKAEVIKVTPPSEEIRAWSERQMELAEKARRLEDSQLTYSERLMQTAYLSQSMTRIAKAGENARRDLKANR